MGRFDSEVGRKTARGVWRGGMPRWVVASGVGLAVAGVQRVGAAPFQNLDFEQAAIVPLPNPPPGNPYEPLDAASAFPSWTVTLGTSVSDQVYGEANILDITSVALVHLGNLYFTSVPAIDGTYDAQLYAVATAPPPDATASVSQTGDIPADAESIRFLIRNPPGASNIPSVPFVFLDETPIPVVPLSSSGGIIMMGGDVSAFAGTTAELRFMAAGDPDPNAGFAGEDIFELDDITLSPEPIPEPGSVGLLALGAMGLVVRRRRGS